LTGSFKEAEDGVVTLKNDDPGTFSRFNGWLYTGVLLGEEEMKVKDSYTPLIDLYLFAEKMMMPSLENDVIDAMLRLAEESDCSLDSEQIQKLWDGTGPSSKLRKFAVDQHVYWMSNLDVLGPHHPHEFVTAVACSLWKFLRGKDPAVRPSEEELGIWYEPDMWESRCSNYHVHEPGKPICEDPI